MMRMTWRAAGLAAVATVVIGSAAACGSSSSPTVANTAAPAQVPVAEETYMPAEFGPVINGQPTCVFIDDEDTGEWCQMAAGIPQANWIEAEDAPEGSPAFIFMLTYWDNWFGTDWYENAFLHDSYDRVWYEQHRTAWAKKYRTKITQLAKKGKWKTSQGKPVPPGQVRSGHLGGSLCGKTLQGGYHTSAVSDQAGRYVEANLPLAQATTRPRTTYAPRTTVAPRVTTRAPAPTYTRAPAPTYSRPPAATVPPAVTPPSARPPVASVPVPRSSSRPSWTVPC